jgi:glycosyltransferase involved in cell wall biosynthesis
MIWGPISGFGLINSSYFKIFPLKTRIKYFAKNIVNSLQAYMPRIQTAIQYPDILIAANSEAKTALQKFRKSGVYLINDTGATNIQFLGDLEKKSKESKFKIAWVGKDVPRKALVLALKAMKEISSADIELHIIGVSEEEYAKYRPLWSDHVINHGIKSHEQTVKLLSQSHMLLFTSLHEGTPHAVLEALSYGVPVVCHDSHGQGDLINESCGIKVALKNPENSVRQFVLAIKKISSDHRYQLKLATGALSHAKDITWEKDIDKVMEMYSLIFNLKRKTVTKKSNLPSHLLQQED